MTPISKQEMYNMQHGIFAAYLRRKHIHNKEFGIYILDCSQGDDVPTRILTSEITLNLYLYILECTRVRKYSHPKNWPTAMKFFLLSEEELIEHVILETI